MSAVESAVFSLGYPSIKPEQERVITEFVSGKDVFVCLPTGFGKSLCFTALPIVFDLIKSPSDPSKVVVISPLNSLMSDQVISCESKGIEAIRVCADEDCKQHYDSVVNGYYLIIYISSELIIGRRLWRNMLLNEHYQKRLVALVIDEAHCVKKNGETTLDLNLRK